jgi:hypothetical protein
MTYDAIDHLKGFEYAEREAAFLYMVAVHSGYFLRRQFNQFVARERGAIATHFLRHATQLGHIEEMPCADSRIIYHLASKQIYAMAGNSDSQGRRVKSLREILRRLIALDYVMKHLAHEHFIESSNERAQFFSQLKISSAVIEGAEAFGRMVPISLPVESEEPIMRLAFLDEGQRSTAMFARFLRTHEALLRALPCAEIVFVSVTPLLFSAAQHIFDRHMPLKNSTHSACPLGVEHLVSWLDVRYRFREEGCSITPEEHRLLQEGECVYHAPVHAGLVASWSNGAMNAEKVRKLFGEEQHRVSFMTELIEANYPRFLDQGVGYAPGYDDAEKCLFNNEIEGKALEKTCH